MNTIEKIMITISAICGIVIAGAVMIWAPPCSGVLELANGNAVPMRCDYTSRIAVLLALIVTVLAVVSLITGKRLGLPILLISIAIIAVTFESLVGIGVCKSEMQCWTMAYWVRISAGVSIFATVIGFIASTNRKKVSD